MANRKGMNGRCQCCLHPERNRFEMLLIGGAQILPTARKFGVMHDSLERHMKFHVSPDRKALLLAGPIPLNRLAERAADEGESVLDQLKSIRGTLYRVLDSAAEVSDGMRVALVSGKLHENLSLTARLTGELVRNTTPTVTNVLVNPDVLELMNAVRVAVAPYPKARMAVVEALDALESRALAKFRPANEPPTIQGEATRVDDA